MIFEHQSKYRNALLLLSALVLIAGAWFLLQSKTQDQCIDCQQVAEEPESVGTLPTTYIKPVEWPPKLELKNAPFVCNEGDFKENGTTERRMINGRTYCVTRVVEAAAGTVYTDYVYETQRDDSVIQLSFTLRAPQCANYDEVQRTECEAEKTNFDLDSLIDRIAQN